MTGDAGVSDRKSFPRELGEFLIEFAIALNRSAMYPDGHPSLERSAGALVERLILLLDERPTLSVGVARQQLVIEGVATESSNPVLRSLAARLHRRGVGAVVFERGAAAEEIEGVLRFMAEDESRDSGAAPLQLPAAGDRWLHVRLYPLAYENLELLEQDPDTAAEDRERARAAQLWIGLARAALAAEDDARADSMSTEPAVVARAINEHAAAVAYDQVIVGYMLQIAEELRQEGPGGSTALSRRMSRLVSELSNDVLERLVAMGGDLDQRRRFILDAADGLAAGAVVELVRAAASATEQTVSHSMLRILSKLSTLAEDGAGRMRTEADHALREQVRALVADWQLPDPNPDAYTAALAEMARPVPVPSTGSRQDTGAEPLRVVQMSIELEAVPHRLGAVVAEVIESGGVRGLLGVAEQADPDNPTAHWIFERLAEPSTIERLSRAGTGELDVLDRVLRHAAPTLVAGPLLDAVAESEERSVRMALLDRVAGLGGSVAGEVAKRLSDERWYVRRNMLFLLGRIGGPPEGVAVLPHLRDAHAAVRHEALQLAVRLPAERERGMALALTERDVEGVRVAVTAAKEGLPPSVAPLAAARLADDAMPDDVRLALVEVLGATRTPLVVEALLRVVAPGTTLLGRPRIAPPTRVVLAALRALATRWPNDRRVAPVLERARGSRDAEIRRAADSPHE